MTDGFSQLLPVKFLLDLADKCFMLLSKRSFLPLQLHVIVCVARKIKSMWMPICRSTRTKAGRYLLTALLNRVRVKVSDNRSLIALTQACLPYKP